ncbi:hypothetical protein ACWEWI_33585 [Streptomyces sp. NPDC003753]|uniref:hypothetical protein n=1 Tax=Streptomyces sp. Y2F8-2 TaxID=2759675 RepID=UPI0019075791|nr:hypothetical protein [Streptomyces sp. Y2F8-2]GHK01641.1 hypothetical protein SY2F82_34380 [Streptomyces sp. Y2F8-2]
MRSVNSGDTALFTDVRLGSPGAETAPGSVAWRPESGVREPDGEGLVRQTQSGTGARLSLADAVDGPSYVFAVRARKTAGGEGLVLGFARTSSRTTLAAQPHGTSSFAPTPDSPVEDRATDPVCDLAPCSSTVLRTRAESVVRARTESDQR